MINKRNDFMLDDILVFHFDFKANEVLRNWNYSSYFEKKNDALMGWHLISNNTLLLASYLSSGVRTNLSSFYMNDLFLFDNITGILLSIFLSKPFFLFSKHMHSTIARNRQNKRKTVGQISIQYFSTWHDETIQVSRALLCIIWLINFTFVG